MFQSLQEFTVCVKCVTMFLVSTLTFTGQLKVNILSELLEQVKLLRSFVFSRALKYFFLCSKERSAQLL